MVKKKFLLGMIVTAIVLCAGLTSCWSTGTARQVLPKTAVTLQRVRSTIFSDIPLQIFVDDNPQELANGATTTILVNNGEHMVYAVLGEVESKSIRFIAKSQTITVNVAPKQKLLAFGNSSGGSGNRVLGFKDVDLTIEVK
jgi:hypothetical protein